MEKTTHGKYYTPYPQKKRDRTKKAIPKEPTSGSPNRYPEGALACTNKDKIKKGKKALEETKKRRDFWSGRIKSKRSITKKV